MSSNTVLDQIYDDLIERSDTVFYVAGSTTDDIGRVKEDVRKVKPVDFDVTKHGYMVSVENTPAKEVLFVLDFDGDDGLTEHIWNVVNHVNDKLTRSGKLITNIKITGKKGIALVFTLAFSDEDWVDWTDHALRLAYTMYKEWGLEYMGVSFGKNHKVPNQTHVLDPCMFEKNRKLRGCCCRFNGNYSIIAEPHTDYDRVVNNMKLGVSEYIYVEHPVMFNTEMVVKEYRHAMRNDILYPHEQGEAKEWKMEFDASGKNILDYIPHAPIMDVEKHLTPYLKAVVNRDLDVLNALHIDHRHKSWLVRYIYHYLGWVKLEHPVKAMVKWMSENCDWDANMDKFDSVRETTLQVRSLVSHINSVAKEDRLIGLPLFVLKGIENVFEETKEDFDDDFWDE